MLLYYIRNDSFTPELNALYVANYDLSVIMKINGYIYVYKHVPILIKINVNIYGKHLRIISK